MKRTLRDATGGLSCLHGGERDDDIRIIRKKRHAMIHDPQNKFSEQTVIVEVFNSKTIIKIEELTLLRYLDYCWLLVYYMLSTDIN